MISKISSAFARLLKPISRGQSAGDLTKKEGSNAGFTAWRKTPAEEKREEPPQKHPETQTSPDEPGVRPGLRAVAPEVPPIVALSEEDRARRSQAEGKKNYFGEGQKSRGGVKIAKGSLYDKKAS